MDEYEKLEKAIMDVLAEDKLEVLPLQVRKIMQFYEATQQRMGVMIVGPSGCGKSTIWKVLQKALDLLGWHHVTKAAPDVLLRALGGQIDFRRCDHAVARSGGR